MTVTYTYPTIPAPVAVGDQVLYRLSRADVERINSIDPARTRRNAVRFGQDYAAVVVATFGGQSTANLQVFLDGDSSYWATSRNQGGEPGQWQYRTANALNVSMAH